MIKALEIQIGKLKENMIQCGQTIMKKSLKVFLNTIIHIYKYK